MKSANTQTLLMIVIVLLVGMIAVGVVRETRDPADKMATSMGEVMEEIGDEIDDNTDVK